MNPTTRTINLLNDYLDWMDKSAEACEYSVPFHNLYDDSDNTPWLGDNVKEFLDFEKSLDKFCDHATKTREFLKRKFQKYHVDRSYFQSGYNDIVNDLYDCVHQQAMNALSKIQKEVFAHALPNDKQEWFEEIVDRVNTAAQRYLDKISAQRCEWPVIVRQKNTRKWHNPKPKKKQAVAQT